MTAEHLLDAIGLLDDGLLQEAEKISTVRRRGSSSRWLGVAASLAVVAGLGYGMVRLGLIGGMSGGGMAGNGGGFWESMHGSTAPAGSAPPCEADGTGGGMVPEDSASPEEPPASLPGGFVQLEGVYLLTGQIEEQLPADAVQEGTLLAYELEGPVPATNVPEYVGLELWAAEDRTALYVALSDGQYAVAELVEP